MLPSEPYLTPTLCTAGLCGEPAIVDIGGPKFLTPLPQLDKLYSFKDIASLIGKPACFMLGKCTYVLHTT